MKKPNITEGDWIPDKTNVAVLSEKGKIIADCFLPFEVTYEQHNNVQAISAVPDMIDALIDDLNLLKGLIETGEFESDLVKQKINKSINALKKAGATKL